MVCTVVPNGVNNCVKWCALLCQIEVHTKFEEQRITEIFFRPFYSVNQRAAEILSADNTRGVTTTRH